MYVQLAIQSVEKKDKESKKKCKIMIEIWCRLCKAFIQEN